MKRFLISAIGLYCALAALTANAAILTFDDLISGETSYGYDGDSDGVDDVIFSTTDPLGFNTIGPGTNMTYIDEPGLEGTSLLDPDLRVEFIYGASGSISFGFALDSSYEDPGFFANFQLFDSNDNLLADVTEIGQYTATALGRSSFPEGMLVADFTGIASYGLFNFTSEFGRYIIDNFAGTYGSTEDPTNVPEPSALFLLATGLAAFGFSSRRKS